MMVLASDGGVSLCSVTSVTSVISVVSVVPVGLSPPSGQRTPFDALRNRW